MNIGIFGDSFASSYQSSGWQNILGRLMKINIDVYGVASTSLWFSYKKFIQHYKKHSQIVFVYTDYSRLNSLSDEYAHISTIVKNTKVVNDEDVWLIDMLKPVLPFIYDDDFQLFVYQHIFNQVNSICRSNQIKLINILPYERLQTRIDISTTAGPCMVDLANVSLQEKGFIDSKIDKRENHLSQKNNIILATKLFEILNKPNPDNKIIDLTNEGFYEV